MLRRPIESALVVLVAVGAFVVRFERHERRADGDTYFYVTQAQEFAGVPASAASLASKELMCQDNRNRLPLIGGTDSSCTKYGAITRPRYTAIFASRPLWPLLLAGPVSLLGVARGVIIVTLLGAMLAALAVFLVLRALGSSAPAAGAAAVAFSLLPTGFWSDKLLPEGAVLATLVVALYAAVRLLQGRGRSVPLVACLAASMVALYAFKPANGMALAVALVVVGAVLLAIQRGGRGRRQALVLVLGVAGVAGWLVVSTLLKLPSFQETAQDMATVHFSRPDTPRPYAILIARNRNLWLHQLPRLLHVPWPYPIVLPSAVVVVYVLRRAGLVTAAVGLAGTVIVVAHPMVSQYDRLVITVWLVVVAAIAVVVDRLPGLITSVAARGRTSAAGGRGGDIETQW